MLSYSTDNRYLYLKTPLAEDDLLLRLQRGRDISELFRFELELLADNAQSSIRPAARAAGRLRDMCMATIWIARPSTASVARRAGGRDQDFTRYRLTSCRGSGCSRKLSKPHLSEDNVPDILKLSSRARRGVPDSRQVAARDYCVQYQEIGFHFASRLMEEEGIFYFFKFACGSHKLVLATTRGASGYQ